MTKLFLLVTLAHAGWWHSAVDTIATAFHPSRGVKLMDIHACVDEPNCVLINGGKLKLAPVPAAADGVVIHGAARVAGGVNYIVETPLRAGASDRVLLLVNKKPGRWVKILGYAVQNELSAKAVPPTVATSVPLYKYLTSNNQLETRLARERVDYELLCNGNVRQNGDTLEVAYRRLVDAGAVPAGDSRVRELLDVARTFDAPYANFPCYFPVGERVQDELRLIRLTLDDVLPAP